MEKTTRIFLWERDTKRTRRYQEQLEPGQTAIIGVLYVQQAAQPGEKLAVTIQDAEQEVA